MNGVTHDDYVEGQRKRLIAVAREVINRKINAIDGCVEIDRLWFSAELPEDDSYDFFSLVSSDTDAFPRGQLREICSQEYLRKVSLEEKGYLEEMGDKIDEECLKLIEKYE